MLDNYFLATWIRLARQSRAARPLQADLRASWQGKRWDVHFHGFNASPFSKTWFRRTLWVQSVCQPAVRRSACPYCHVYFPEFSIFVYDLEVFRLSEFARPTRGLGRSMCSISSPIPRSCLILQEGKQTCSHLQCDPDMRRCHVPYCAGVKALVQRWQEERGRSGWKKIASKKNSIHKRCLDYS